MEGLLRLQGCHGYGDSHGYGYGDTNESPWVCGDILMDVRLSETRCCDKCQSRFRISPNIFEFIIFLQLGLNDC